MSRITHTVPSLLGMLRMPEGWEPDIEKGAGHKYVKRVPYVDGKGRRRYRYYYKVTAGYGVGNDFHMVVGAAFQHGNGHYHITAVDGDRLTIRHDETGKTYTITKKALAEKLHVHHNDALNAHKRKIYEKLKATTGARRAYWVGQARRYGVTVPKAAKATAEGLTGKERQQAITTAETYEKNAARAEKRGQKTAAQRLRARAEEIRRKIDGREQQQAREKAEAKDIGQRYAERVGGLKLSELRRTAAHGSAPYSTIANEEIKRREAEAAKKKGAGKRYSGGVTGGGLFTNARGHKTNAAVMAEMRDGETFKDALHRLASAEPHRVPVDVYAEAKGATSTDLGKIRKLLGVGPIEGAALSHLSNRARNALREHRSAVVRAVKSGAKNSHPDALAQYPEALRGADKEGARARSRAEAEKDANKRKLSAPKHAPQLSLRDDPLGVVRQHVNDMRAGKVTAAEHKERFRALTEDPDAVKAALSRKYKKAQLDRLAGGWRKYDRKAQAVEAAYRRLVQEYTIGDSLTWQPMSESYEDAVKRQIDGITDDHIREHAQKHAARLAERAAAKEAHEKALANPKTLEDFHKFAKHKGRKEMTPEQQRQYDRLHAEDTRTKRAKAKAEAREAARPKGEVVGSSGGVTIEAGKHTKKGHDIWTAKLAGRVERDEFVKLRAAAKAEGGYYSRWGGGFIFNTPEGAKRFAERAGGSVPTGDAPAAPEPAKSKPGARLREVADRKHSAGHDSLHADRRTNTARRAAMASHAAASAMEDMRLAKQARSIADALDRGEAKHLAGVRAMSHVEELDSIAGRARHHAVLAEAKAKHGDDRYGNKQHDYYENNRHRDLTHADYEAAEYPYPAEYVDHVESMLVRLKGKRGSRGFAQIRSMVSAAKRAKNDRSLQTLTFKTDSQREEFARLLALAKRHDSSVGWYGEESTKRFNRVRAMGIHTPAELREALREYEAHSKNAEVDNTKQRELEIKAREQELARSKIPGYFPTPKDVVGKMLRAADVRDGHSVLEPSAGAGHIADRVRSAGADVHTVEFSHSLREHLQEKGHNVVGNDALNYHGQHDRVVMNPPFERGQDIDHVRHAFEHNLKAGGKLVAIMSEGAFGRSDKKAEAFREWLASHGGKSQKLPAGSFKQSDRSTGVNTRMVVISKPGGTKKGRRARPVLAKGPFTRALLAHRAA